MAACNLVSYYKRKVCMIYTVLVFFYNQVRFTIIIETHLIVNIVLMQ